jgi:hypothetical protein
MGAVMKSSISELAAAWIVALALIAAMAVDVLLPKTPPALGPGVTLVGTQRPAVNVPATVPTPDMDLPLMEFGGPFGPSTDDNRTIATPRRPNSGSDNGIDQSPRHANG